MSNKSSSSTITSTEVRELLRTASKQLSAREEKTLRMRSGAGLARTEPLPKVTGAPQCLAASRIQWPRPPAASGATTCSAPSCAWTKPG